MIRAAALLLSLGGALATTPLPWAYNWSSYPAAWFGANKTLWESPEQIAEIGKYSMAILGWQHLLDQDQWESAVYTQLTQAAIIKEAHPHLPVMVYAGFGWGFGLNAAVEPLMQEPDKYSDFFLQSTHGPVLTRTNCEQTGESNPRCVGWFWKFSNASARAWFLEKLVAPLAAAPMIDGVFFDAVNYGYDIPEVRPFGMNTLNVPNCSKDGGEGCDALVQGTIEVAVGAAKLLNAHGKAPMFANPGSFVRGLVGTNIWLNESALLDALDGTQYIIYYESARAEQIFARPPRAATPTLPARPPTAIYDNMLAEARRGVPVAMHAYYHANATTGVVEDEAQHVAAFMLLRQENWYFLGSTGWFDKDYRWSRLYDLACGRPAAPASSPREGVYERAYEACSVTLDCTAALNASAKPQPPCSASIVGPAAPSWPAVVVESARA